MRLFFIFLIACNFFLMSCYTTVPLTLYKDSYKDDSYLDREESEENEFRVVAKGNPATPMDRVSDYAILRSAQLMKQEGFEYFVVSKQINDYDIDQHLSTQVVAGNYGAYSTTGVVDVRNPVSGVLITGYNEKPTREARGKNKVYKTDDVLEDLGHYINETPPKELNQTATIAVAIPAVTVLGIVGLLIWITTL